MRTALLLCVLSVSSALASPMAWRVEAQATLDPSSGLTYVQATESLLRRYLVTVSGGLGTDTLMFEALAGGILYTQDGAELYALSSIVAPFPLDPIWGSGPSTIIGCQAPFWA